MSVVRWPGGCFASGYHWKDGVGPNSSSRPRIPAWGVVDPNTFGTDEFVEWCRLVGCEPYICTNAGNGTPEEMSQLGRVLQRHEGPCAAMRKAGGHDKPLGVRYLEHRQRELGTAREIGNKPTKEWGPLVRTSAQLMLAADPDISLLAAATPNSRLDPAPTGSSRKTPRLRLHPRLLAGSLAKNAMPDYLSCITLSDGPEQTIAR